MSTRCSASRSRGRGAAQRGRFCSPASSAKAARVQRARATAPGSRGLERSPTLGPVAARVRGRSVQRPLKRELATLRDEVAVERGLKDLRDQIETAKNQVPRVAGDRGAVQNGAGESAARSQNDAAKP